MKQKLLSYLILALASGLGFSAGFFVSKSVYKKKYEKYADEEIESVKKVYEKHFAPNEEAPKSKEETAASSKKFVSKSTLDEPLDGGDDSAPLKKSAKKPAYTDYAAKYGAPTDPNVKPAPHVKEAMAPKNIYILTPEEFQSSGYDVRTLYYYKDGVLADDDYNVIKTPIELVGPDALKSFGRYEDDAVYVRNEVLKVDFEILLSSNSYLDVAPHGAGVPSDD